MDPIEKDLFGVPSYTEHLNKELLQDLTLVLMKHTPSSLKDTEKYLGKAWSNVQKTIDLELSEWKYDDITMIDRVELKNHWKIYVSKLLKYSVHWKMLIEDLVYSWFAEFQFLKDQELDFSDSMWKDSKASADDDEGEEEEVMGSFPSSSSESSSSESSESK